MALRSERQRVQHLLRRAGFGYSPAELEEYLALGLEGAVEQLLRPETVDDSLVRLALDAAVEEDPREKRAALFQWWHLRLLLTRRPLLEKLTYFWHDHFATGIHKVGDAGLMLEQNETLRGHALGSFHDLLLAVTRDPAMMVWRDNRSNRKGAPNENYARELMELHTMGEGSGYTESDVKEAARALTGWRLTSRDEGPRRAFFSPRHHDGGQKSVLGTTGRLDDAALIDVLAEHPATVEHIGRKLWQFFAVPNPGPGQLARTSEAYRAHHGSIREVVRVILLSPEMYSDAAYRWRIKSPVELVIGAERALGAESRGRSEVSRTRGMGQVLFDPPSPAGWPGGPAWVNSTTMLARANFAADLTGRKPRGVHLDLPATLERSGATESAEAVVDWVLDLLVGGDVDATTRELLVEHLGGPHHYDFEKAARSGAVHGMVYLALSMPLYQLA
jgi:uncharacterized protein (DUF1800 family)